MELINLAGEELDLGWLDKPKNKPEKLIVLPDYSHIREGLPVGSVAFYPRNNHIPSYRFLGSDIGCGMLAAKFDRPLDSEGVKNVNYEVYSELKWKDTELGTLGGGNHFITLYRVDSSDSDKLKIGDMLALIHSGSRSKGVKINNKQLEGDEYLEAYEEAIEYAERNRSNLLEIIRNGSDQDLKFLFDLAHNTVEMTDSHYIYRKGAIKLRPGHYGIISSSMTGDAILIKGIENIEELENSVCHGTGRKISRSEAKEMEFDSEELRREIYILYCIYDDYLKTEAPHCYRTLDEVLSKIDKYVEVVARLKPLSTLLY